MLYAANGMTFEFILFEDDQNEPCITWLSYVI